MRTELTLGVGLDMHEQMLDALARGDSVAARNAVETEISEAAAFMVRSLIADADREAAQ
jgi:DNA-binding GntR family transcriptional regulator